MDDIKIFFMDKKNGVKMWFDGHKMKSKRILHGYIMKHMM